MKAGEVWTASTGGKGYAGKPRPVIIIQDKSVDSFESIILCLLSSENTGGSHRVRIEPTVENGLNVPSWVMTEKIMAIRKTALGRRIGVLREEELDDIRHSIAYLLGL